jgi:peptidyl-tRNA hydrolase
MNPVQYIILNKGLGMSTGKAAAQAAHASVEGVRISAKTPGGNPWDSSIVNRWYRGGHYAKIVLEAEDGPAIQVARQYIEARGFKTALIIDEGRTEVEPMSVTALGVEIVDKDWPHARETFSAFKLYSDEPTLIELPALTEGEIHAVFERLFPESRPSWLQRAAAKMHAKADELEAKQT